MKARLVLASLLFVGHYSLAQGQGIGVLRFEELPLALQVPTDMSDILHELQQGPQAPFKQTAIECQPTLDGQKIHLDVGPQAMAVEEVQAGLYRLDYIAGSGVAVLCRILDAKLLNQQVESLIEGLRHVQGDAYRGQIYLHSHVETGIPPLSYFEHQALSQAARFMQDRTNSFKLNKIVVLSREPGQYEKLEVKTTLRSLIATKDRLRDVEYLIELLQVELEQAESASALGVEAVSERYTRVDALRSLIKMRQKQLQDLNFSILLMLRFGKAEQFNLYLPQ